MLFSNAETYRSTSRDDALTQDKTGCNPSKPLAIIVHGWRESCSTAWVVDLRSSE